MKFPYPEQPANWQTAYDRDDAHRDSRKFDVNLTLPLLLCGLFVLAYALFWLARFGYLAGIIQLILTVFGPRWSVPAGLVLILATVLIGFPRLMRLVTFPVASSFLSEFYCPPEEIDPKKIIRYRLFGKSKLPWLFSMFSRFEYLLVQDGKILKEDQWPAWSAQHLGGPFQLIIFDGCALYLERGNRFSRVVGPGDKIPFLEWYETIKYVVDLRPKVKVETFDAWTKDGIKIKLTAQIECRIGNPANKPPAPNLVYPYDPVAVKKAIERYALRWPNRQSGEPSEFTWVDAAWGQVTGILPSYIGSRMLDDLFMAERESGQILSPEALKELIGKLNNATNGFGVYVTDFQLMKIDFPEAVYKYQKEQWKAERQSIATATEGDARAHKIRVREKVRADAQRELILTIASGLHKNKDDQFIEPLLLSLSGLLDESLKDPISRADLARQKLESLEELQKILDQYPILPPKNEPPKPGTGNDNEPGDPPSVHFIR